jgi:hypothetical protein
VTARRTAGVLAATTLLLGAGGFAVPASAGGPTTIGLRNGVSERSFSLSRTRVPPGLAIIQYTNTGEDPHDVRIRRRGSATILELPETEPGGVATFPLMKLKQDSKYIIWCSLDGHRESGMEADLRVRRRR